MTIPFGNQMPRFELIDANGNISDSYTMTHYDEPKLNFFFKQEPQTDSFKAKSGKIFTYLKGFRPHLEVSFLNEGTGPNDYDFVKFWQKAIQWKSGPIRVWPHYAGVLDDNHYDVYLLNDFTLEYDQGFWYGLKGTVVFEGDNVLDSIVDSHIQFTSGGTWWFWQNQP